MEASLPLLLGTSPAIRQVMEEAQKIAPTNSKVLITGETGVGKELLARTVHAWSRRSHQPMVTVNCAGLTETLLESELFGHVRGSFTGAHRDHRGFLELANGGTALLDEVGEMTLRMQRMLLRFLDNGEIQRVGAERSKTVVDVRIVAATNRDLPELIQRKEFRDDLYYRLNVAHLVIAPLRARREDIKLLFEHYIRRISQEHALAPAKLSPNAIAALEEYNWPGNIRELRNVAERLMLTHPGGVITRDDLPPTLLQGERSIEARPGASVANTPETIAALCYSEMVDNSQSFWTVVYEPFMLRDLTRETVRLIVRAGLQRTKGSYRLVSELFNLPAQDYKRFLNFLQKYDCHMPFQKFRVVGATLDSGAARPRPAARVS